MPGRRRGCGLTGVSLIDPSYLDAVVGDDLNGSGHGFDLTAILGAGRCDMQGQQVTQGIDRNVDLGAFLALGSIITASSPLSGAERKVLLSMIAALGSPLRPAARRSITRRSSIRASKHPAASQHCVCG